MEKDISTKYSSSDVVIIKSFRYGTIKATNCQYVPNSEWRCTPIEPLENGMRTDIFFDHEIIGIDDEEKASEN